MDPELLDFKSELQRLVALGWKFDELKDVDLYVLGPPVVQSREVYTDCISLFLMPDV